MNICFGLLNLGGGEIILILALVLILFGAKKLPELAKGLGSGIKEFKKATREVTDEIQTAMDDQNYSQPPRKIEPPPQKQLPQTPQAEQTPAAQPEATVPQSPEAKS